MMRLFAELTAAISGGCNEVLLHPPSFDDFLSKWEHALRNDSQSTCDVKSYIRELGTIVDALSV